jgi:hypothetical protein
LGCGGAKSPAGACTEDDFAEKDEVRYPSSPAKHKHYKRLLASPHRERKPFCYHSFMDKYKTVDEFLSSQPKDKTAQIEALRHIILSTEPRLEEHIKWNAPSYVSDGIDRITFNVMNKDNTVMLVFHMGATRKENKKGTPVISDDSHLIKWASDIRGYAIFKDIEDVAQRVAF